jgi:UDP-2,4-diacetamido-2,4,6-trideoxy-beta-L-altropyranose hydrolase
MAGNRKMPKVAIRADASLQIGSGHVMRCLTLAAALRDRGAECHFICRELPGHIGELVRDRQFALHTLPPCSDHAMRDAGETASWLPSHADWLGCSWQEDARQSEEILKALQPDWLVTDHYAIDARWHAALSPHYGRLMVIDDLADRPQLGDILLDQTFARSQGDYADCVPENCRLLCGSRYALLRPEFSSLREQSLQRRKTTAGVRHLLVTMGGIDKDNVTVQVLDALSDSELPADCEITIVMGMTAPWLDEVRTRAASLAWPTRVRVNARDMASIMASADLCIGAAGSTAWERCTLGLPTIMVITAANQVGIAAALQGNGAALCAGAFDSPRFAGRLQASMAHFLGNPRALSDASAAAADVTDGTGVQIVCDALLEEAMQ